MARDSRQRRPARTIALPLQQSTHGGVAVLASAWRHLIAAWDSFWEMAESEPVAGEGDLDMERVWSFLRENGSHSRRRP